MAAIHFTSIIWTISGRKTVSVTITKYDGMSDVMTAISVLENVEMAMLYIGYIGYILLPLFSAFLFIVAIDKHHSQRTGEFRMSEMRPEQKKYQI